MAWALSNGPRAVKLTRKLARDHAAMERCPHDRDLQHARMDHLRRVIMEGRFRPPEWISTYCKETDTVYRINGKHTSTLLSGLDKLPDIKVILSEYHCSTLQDVADLYATIDARFSSRSPRDIYTVYGQAVPEMAHVQSHVLAICAAGMGFANHETASTRVPTERKARYLVENPDFVVWVSDMDIRQSENKYMARACVIAAMFKTWQKSRLHCVNFWKEVRDGSDSNPKSASRVLQRWLMSNVLTGKNTLSQESNRVTDHEMMSRCIHGYNAWKKGSTTDLKYFSDKPTPEVA